MSLSEAEKATLRRWAEQESEEAESISSSSSSEDRRAAKRRRRTAPASLVDQIQSSSSDDDERTQRRSARTAFVSLADQIQSSSRSVDTRARRSAGTAYASLVDQIQNSSDDERVQKRSARTAYASLVDQIQNSSSSESPPRKMRVPLRAKPLVSKPLVVVQEEEISPSSEEGTRISEKKQQNKKKKQQQWRRQHQRIKPLVAKPLVLVQEEEISSSSEEGTRISEKKQQKKKKQQQQRRQHQPSRRAHFRDIIVAPRVPSQRPAGALLSARLQELLAGGERERPPARLVGYSSRGRICVAGEWLVLAGRRAAPEGCWVALVHAGPKCLCAMGSGVLALGERCYVAAAPAPDLAVSPMRPVRVTRAPSWHTRPCASPAPLPPATPLRVPHLWGAFEASAIPSPDLIGPGEEDKEEVDDQEDDDEFKCSATQLYPSSNSQ